AATDSPLDEGTSIWLYRRRPDRANGKHEQRILFSRVNDGGNVSFWGRAELGLAQTGDIGAPGTLPNLGGVSGIIDTATETDRGRVEFYMGNQLVMMIDD